MQYVQCHRQDARGRHGYYDGQHLHEVFAEGFLCIAEALEDRILELEEIPRGEKTNEEQTELKELKTLTPETDFTWFVNARDTHFNGCPASEETYRRYLPDALDQCEAITGFRIEW